MAAKKQSKGPTKVKVPKKKRTAAKGAPGEYWALKQLAEAKELIANVVDLMDSPGSSGVINQQHLEVALVAKEVAKLAKSVRAQFDEAAIAHHEQQGTFEPGEIAINFNQTSKRSPKWKDEACEQAQLLAHEQGNKLFRMEEFVKSASAKYPAKDSTSVQIKRTGE